MNRCARTAVWGGVFAQKLINWLAAFVLCLALPLFSQARLDLHKRVLQGGTDISSVLAGDLFYYSLNFEASSGYDEPLNAVITDTLPADLIFVTLRTDASGWVDSWGYDKPSHSVRIVLKSPFATGVKPEVFIDVRFPYGRTCPGTLANNHAWIKADNAETVRSNNVSVSATIIEPAMIVSNNFLVDCPAIEVGSGVYALNFQLNNGCPAAGNVAPNTWVHVGSQNLYNITLRDSLPLGAEVVDAAGGTVTIDPVSGCQIVSWNFGNYVVDDTTGRLIEWPAGWDTQLYPFCCKGAYSRTITISVRFPDASFDVGQYVNLLTSFTATRECQGDIRYIANARHPLCTLGLRGYCNKSIWLSPSFDKQAVVGQTFSMNLTFVNNSNVPLDTLITIDAMPPCLKVLSHNTLILTDGAGPMPPMYMQFKLSTPGAVWTDVPGSPYAASDAATRNWGITGDVLVDSIRIYFKNKIPEGARYSIVISMRLMENDRDGNPVTIGQSYSNSMHNFYRWNDIPRSTTCTDHFRIVGLKPPLVWLRYDLINPPASGFYAHGDIASFSVGFTYVNYATDREPLYQPVLATLVPLGLELVDWVRSSSSADLKDPVLETIPNYLGDGRTLLRWRWTGAAADTFRISGSSYNFRVRYRITSQATNGLSRHQIELISCLNAQGFELEGYPHDAGELRGYLGPDTYDLDADGSTTDNNVYNPAEFQIRGTVEYRGDKHTRSSFSADWVQSPDISWTVPGGLFDYRITFTNTGQASLTSAEAIDILPFIGDTEVKSTSSRGSLWQPVLDQPISAASNCTVYYSTEGNPDRPEYGVSGTPPNWSTIPPADLASVRSLRFVWDFTASPLISGQSVALTFPMRAPQNAPVKVVAHNTYALRGYDGAAWNLATEPLAALNAVGDASLQKSNAIDTLEIGQLFDYAIHYTSPIDLNEAFIADTLAACFEYVSSSGGTSSHSENGIVVWRLTDLQRDETGTVTVRLRVADNCTESALANCVYFYTFDLNHNRIDLGEACDQDVLLRYGTIGDRVWYDLDGGNDQDADESGIPGVIVHLLASDNTFVAADTTDGLGLYLFPEVLPGDYHVTVVAASVPANHNLTGGILPHPVSISAGESYLLADFGYQPAPGTVGDYVWFDEDGNGNQDSGEPGMADVILYLVDAQGDTVARDTTDSSGRYLFLDVVPGAYAVHVNASTIPPHHTLTGGTAPHPLNLLPGASYLEADFGYQPDPAQIGDYVWHDLNGDFIQDASESGIANAMVQLLHPVTRQVIATAFTGENGRYLFSSVRPGTYLVSQNINTIPPTYSATGGNNPITVTVAPGDRYLDADFGYRAVGIIGDYVWLDLDHDAIQDPDESGIPNMVLYLYDMTGKRISKTRTNTLGNYYFRNVPIGDYYIEIDESTLPPGLHITTGKKRFDVHMNEADRLLYVDFGYVGGTGVGGACGKPVFAWYEAWFASASSDSSLRHWDRAKSGGVCDTALFSQQTTTWTREHVPSLYDSRDPDMWEHDILAAWAVDIDVFVVDWYGATSFENQALLGLLNTADHLWQKYNNLGFDFRIAVSYHEKALGNLADNLHFLADSVLVHPAYFNGREGLPSRNWQDFPRPLFVQSLTRALIPEQFRLTSNTVLAGDIQIIWNWDEYDLSLRGWIDSVYPWVQASDLHWDEVRGLEWGSRYLDRFYQSADTLGVKYLTGAVWPGYDDRKWISGENHWMDRQDTMVYRWTWHKAFSELPAWLLIESWNDFNRGTHVASSLLYRDRFYKMTRNKAVTWKGGRPCARAIPDLGLQVPDSLLSARKREVEPGIISSALLAFFSGDYNRALNLLAPAAAHSDPGQPSAANALVFVCGSETFPGQDWFNAIDGDTEGWDGTVTARPASGPEDPVWAIFAFTGQKYGQFEYITLQTDNGSQDDGVADRQAVLVELMVSQHGIEPADFTSVAKIRVRKPAMVWYNLGSLITAKYVKLIIHEPRWGRGQWRQIVEFGVNNKDKKGARLVNSEAELAALPEAFQLEQNYPNPFNARTIINFSLPQDGEIDLTIFDVRGRVIAALLSGYQSAGNHRVEWRADEHPNGIYICRLKAGHFTKSIRLVLLK